MKEWLSKISVVEIFCFLIVFFGLMYAVGVTWFPIPDANKSYADTVIGFMLGTVVSGGVGFMIGSSKGSRDKDKDIN